MVALNLDRVVLNGTATATTRLQFFAQARQRFWPMLEARDDRHGFAAAPLTAALDAEIMLSGRAIGLPSFQRSILTTKLAPNNAIAIFLLSQGMSSPYVRSPSCFWASLTSGTMEATDVLPGVQSRS